jgi:intracellular sulfur oxidation DsrE/DsrF family protein
MGRYGVSFYVLVVLSSCLLAVVVPGESLLAQGAPEAHTGPVIQDYGPVYDIPDPDLAPPRDQVLRVVFEVAQASPEPDRVNRRIETLARYLNMHARAGVPRENMKLALVVHGGASWELVDNPTYQDRFGVDNPNLPLLDALSDFGVEIVLCGQSQNALGIERESLASPVRQALSAMTALVEYQMRGYSLITF